MAAAEHNEQMSAALIRSAQAEDAAELAALAGELGYPSTTEQMSARLALLARLPEHWVGVAATLGRACEGPALLGWIHVARCFALESGEYGEILGLVVGARARRTGVGRLLLAAAERWSGDRGLARVTVRSNVLRLESHRFYPMLGYQLEKSQQVYLKQLR